MRRATFMIAVIASIVLATEPLNAQAFGPDDPGQALTQYRIDQWQTEQGLPLNTVQCLLQTRDGYLWVGTGGGLTRFDGVRFKTFQPSELPAAKPIFGLMEDSAGNLWIGHSVGAAVYRNGLFQDVLGREVTEGKRVWDFAEAPDRSIWIATANGLVRWKGEITNIYRESDGLPTSQIRAVAFDDDGLLWIATTGGGLVSYDGTTFEVFDETRGFPHREVRHVVADPEGGIWAATAGGGLAHVRDGAIRTWNTNDGLPTDQLVMLSIDPDGSLWIATWGAGLVRMHEGKFDSISTDRGLAGDQLWSVHADSEGSVWVGTWVNGLNRLRDRDFVVVGTSEGLSHDNVRAVLHARDGTAWITTAGGGVNTIRNGRIGTIQEKDGLPSNEACAIMQSRDGAIWVGTYTGGVARIVGNSIERWGTDDGLPSVDVRLLFEDSRGTIWAGTRWGLARFTGSGFEAVREPGAPKDGVSAAVESRDGSLWFGASGEGLVHYRDGVFRTLTREDGLVSNWVMALYEDADGNLWAGTNGEGMNRISPEGVVSAIDPEDGLWDPIVQTLTEDSLGYLWITCNRGFYRVARSELIAFTEGRIPAVTSEGFGPGNALRSTTFAGGHQPASAIDAAGNLWLPSFSGLVIVDPAHLPGSEQPPSVHLEEVTVNGQSVPAQADIEIPPGAAQLSIRYTADTLQNADRVRFRYQMEGASEGWVDAGGSREAFFPALPHGKYRFRVAASYDGTHWNEAPRTLSITVQPRFFQTTWFLLLLIGSVLLIGAIIVWLWTRHLRSQQAEMERLVAEKTEELRQANDHLAQLSFADALTGLANRRRFDEALDQEWRRAYRTQAPLAVIVADVDLFKEYNDTLGHLQGDRCLASVAEVFRGLVRRAGDLVARYGGEEFVVLIPGADRDTAVKVAEELRKAVESRAIPHPSSTVAPVVTISLGVAAAVPNGEASETLVAEADAALYRAKRDGRNRVCCPAPAEAPSAVGHE